MANAVLIVFILAFWTLLWVAIKADHLFHHRPFSDGPSFIPVIPIIPAVSFGIGWLLNYQWAPIGTVLVIACYAVWIFYSTVTIIAEARRSKRKGENELDDRQDHPG